MNRDGDTNNETMLGDKSRWYVSDEVQRLARRAAARHGRKPTAEEIERVAAESAAQND